MENRLRHRFHHTETGNYIYKFQRKVGDTWYDLRDNNRKLITEPNIYRANGKLEELRR
jgi:hypothetical protein